VQPGHDGPWETVAGVAENVKNNGLTEQDDPEIYSLRHSAAEDWGAPDTAETVINGDNRVIITNKSRALLKAPGKITVNAATQPVNITTGNSGFGFFPRQNLEQYSISSTRPVITAGRNQRKTR